MTDADLERRARLPDLDRLYPAILELTGPADSIADLACALNPCTVPWLWQTSATLREEELVVLVKGVGGGTD
jgi:hypothetical protein